MLVKPHSIPSPIQCIRSIEVHMGPYGVWDKHSNYAVKEALFWLHFAAVIGIPRQRPKKRGERSETEEKGERKERRRNSETNREKILKWKGDKWA